MFVQIVQEACGNKLSIGIVNELFSEILLHFCEYQPHFYCNRLLNLLSFLDQVSRHIIPDNHVFFVLIANLLSKFNDCVILIFEPFLEGFVKFMVALLDTTNFNSHDVQVVFVFQTFLRRFAHCIHAIFLHVLLKKSCEALVADL